MRLHAHFSSLRHAWSTHVALLGALAAACGPSDNGKPAADETGGTAAVTSEDDATEAASATSTTGSDDDAMPEPIPCTPTMDEREQCPGKADEAPESWFRCGGPDSRCWSLLCDDNNCGECGYTCGGTCLDGVCGSFASPCVTQDDGFQTCAEVCANFGHDCENRLSSEGNHEGCDRGYAYSLADPYTGEPKCGQQFGANNQVSVACSELITWDHGTEEQPQTGVSCCCEGDS